MIVRYLRAGLPALIFVMCVVGVAAHLQDDPQQLVKEAASLSAAGRQDEALAVYRRALSARPDLFEAQIGMGTVLDLKGRYKEAREHLTRAIELAKESAPRAQALNAMAVSYAFEGNARDAAKYYQRLLDSQMTASDYAGAAATANALGRLFLETGDPSNALKWYQTGYETARRLPDQPESQLSTWEMRWHHAQARIAARRGARAEAEQHVAETRAVIEKMGPESDQWPVFQYLAGYVKFYAGDYDAAVTELEKADLRDPFILGLIAQAYERKGETARAREYYDKVLASNAHSLQNAFARAAARKKASSRR